MGKQIRYSPMVKMQTVQQFLKGDLPAKSACSKFGNTPAYCPALDTRI